MLLSQKSKQIVQKTIPLVSLLVLCSVLFLCIGVYLGSNKSLLKWFENQITATKNIGRTLFVRSQVKALKTFTIDIKHKELQKLVYQRELAVKQRINNPVNNEYANAKGHLEDKKKVKLKMRLKGVGKDHWQDKKKWSFRVKVDGKGAVSGMKHFSLVVPEARDYIYEWLFLRALGREGLIEKRFDFVSLVINGKNYGLYALEEHFAPELIHKNKRPLGPILSFNKDLYVAEQIRNRNVTRNPVSEAAFNSSYIDASQLNKLSKDPEQLKLFTKASKILNDFRAGRRSVLDTFDAVKLAKLFAVKALFGSLELDYNDTKFYFNPETSLFEAIGSEVHQSTTIGEWWINKVNDRTKAFVELFMNDAEFLKLYIKELDRVSKRSYLSGLYKELGLEDGLLANKLKALYAEFPYYHFFKNDLFKNQKHIKDALHPEKAVHVYFQGIEQSPNGEKLLALKVSNIHEFPVEVTGVDIDGQKIKLSQTKYISGKTPGSVNEYELVKVSLPYKIKTFGLHNMDFSNLRSQYVTKAKEFVESLKLDLKLFGLKDAKDYKKSIEVFYWPYVSLGYWNHAANLGEKSQLDRHEFIDGRSDLIVFKPGNWTLRETVLIPESKKVIFQAGHKLTLKNGANIVSYSPVFFKGTANRPVKIRSAYKGGSIVVYDAEEKSIIENTIFDGMLELFDGAIAFYNADVDIVNSHFISSRASSALSLLDSEFSIKNSSFSQASFNAVQANNSKGTIVNNEFTDIANNAIVNKLSQLEVKGNQSEAVLNKFMSYI